MRYEAGGQGGGHPRSPPARRGRAGGGRCGVDSDSEHITEPTRVPISSEYTVLDISAGEDHSVITVRKKPFKSFIHFAHMRIHFLLQ